MRYLGISKCILTVIKKHNYKILIEILQYKYQRWYNVEKYIMHITASIN